MTVIVLVKEERKTDKSVVEPGSDASCESAKQPRPITALLKEGQGLI